MPRLEADGGVDLYISMGINRVAYLLLRTLSSKFQM
jgi:hypothetical protein